MGKEQKKIQVVFWCVIIALFTMLGLSKSAFAIHDRVFYALCWLLALASTFFIINQLWHHEFIRYVDTLLPILREDKTPDLYIAENKKLLQGRKSEVMKTILRINICMGYCEKGDYEEAQHQLEAINITKLHGFHRAIYLAGCAYVAFYLGETEKALTFMKQNWRGLHNLQNSPTYGGLVAILHIFELLAVDNPTEACKLHSASQNWYKDELTKDDFEYLQQMLKESQ